MQTLEIVTQQEVLGKDFKVYGDFQNPMFSASDVAEWLEYKSSQAILKSVAEEDKVLYPLSTSDGEKSTWFLTEAGLYQALSRRRKAIAKELKGQVELILNKLRTSVIFEEDPTSDLMTKEGVIRVLETLKKSYERNAMLEAKIQEDSLKVAFAEAVSASPDSIFVGDLSTYLNQKGIDIGQNRLFEWLRNRGYVITKGSRRNAPSQKALNLGLLELKEMVVAGEDGISRVCNTTKVTAKGQIYFVQQFLIPTTPLTLSIEG